MKALAHEQPDTVPYDIRFTEPARARTADYYGDPDFEVGFPTVTVDRGARELEEAGKLVREQIREGTDPKRSRWRIHRAKEEKV